MGVTMSDNILAAKQALQLAGQFRLAAMAVGDRVFAEWDAMPKKDRAQLQSLEVTLFNLATDLTTQAVPEPQVWKMLQPPLSVASRELRRWMTVPQSLSARSTFMPARFSVSAVTWPSGPMSGKSVGLMITTFWLA
jgi:hypothetical protein